MEKHKDHVMFTGTAMIPGEPDCDHESGEKIFTEQEISEFRESYKNYGIIDEEHTFLINGKSVGEPVDDFLLPGPTKMNNVQGEEREYPKGTWVVKSKITDPELMIKAEKGEVAYSPTVIPEGKARELMAAKGRTLIKDVPNAVVYTLSLTTHPCIDNSCSTKSGRSISKQNKSVLEKARDAIDGLLNLDKSNTGGDNMAEENKTDEYVTKSDFDEFKTEVVDTIKEATKSKEKDPVCWKCDSKIVGKSKFCSECGDSLDKTAKKFKEESEESGEEGNGSKAIKNHDNGEEKVAFKSIESYAGRDLKGRPLKKGKEDK